MSCRISGRIVNWSRAFQEGAEVAPRSREREWNRTQLLPTRSLARHLKRYTKPSPSAADHDHRHSLFRPQTSARRMKVLLDESCPVQPRAHLAHHETFTTEYAGFGGFKNGALLKAAEDSGFNILVTADQTLQYEQNLTRRKLALVCLTANSWKIVKNHVQRIVEAIDQAQAGALIRVDCGRFVRPKRSPGPAPG